MSEATIAHHKFAPAGRRSTVDNRVRRSEVDPKLNWG